MTKHTEGPWKAITDMTDDQTPIVIGKFGDLPTVRKICTCHSNNAENNAQLIAAAPELLEIAKEYLAMFESFGEHMPKSTKKHRQKIRKVVAKAEGDSND